MNLQGEKCLLEICQKSSLNQNDLEMLEKLIDRRVDINVNGPMGFTPLLLVCWKNRSPNIGNVVELFIRSGASVHQQSANGWTVLHVLFRYNQSDQLTKMVKLLLQQKVKVNLPNDKGSTAVHFLCRYNQNDKLGDVLSLLIDKQVDLNVATNKGWTPLHLLCSYNQSDRLIDLIRIFMKRNVNLNARTEDGFTVLHLLCKFNQTDQLVDLVQLLTERDASLAKAKTKDGGTALHFLCRHNYNENLPDVVKLLLQNQVDVNAKATDGTTFTTSNISTNWQRSAHLRANSAVAKKTALHLLCRYNQSHVITETARLLLQNKADAAVKDESGCTALHLVCRYHTTDQLINVVHLLIQQVNLNEQDDQGKTALDYLPVNGNPQFHQIVDLFMEKESNLAVSSDFIIKAAQFGCVDVVGRFAARCRADRDVSNYLKTLKNESFSLCPHCRKNRVDVAQLLVVNRSKMAPVTFCKQTLERSIPPNVERLVSESESVHRTEIPSADTWNTLVNNWHSDSPNMQPIVNYFKSQSHQTCVVNCKWCRTGSDVARFVQLLTDKLTELDERFEVERCINHGSFWEKSRLWAPDRLDFALVFKRFRQSERHDDHVTYASANGIEALQDGAKNLHPLRFAHYFNKLVAAAVDRMEDVNIFSPRVRNEGCDVIIEALHRAKLPPALPVRIVLKMAVPMQPHFEMLQNLPSWCSRNASYLTPFNAEGVPKWRIFYPELERHLLTANPNVLEALKLLKMLVALEQKNAPNSKLSARILKVCLLHYLRINPPEDWKSNHSVKHCIGILQQYPVDRCEITSFFQSDVHLQDVDHQSRKTVLQILEKLQKVILI